MTPSQPSASAVTGRSAGGTSGPGRPDRRGGQPTAPRRASAPLGRGSAVPRAPAGGLSRSAAAQAGGRSGAEAAATARAARCPTGVDTYDAGPRGARRAAQLSKAGCGRGRRRTWSPPDVSSTPTRGALWPMPAPPGPERAAHRRGPRSRRRRRVPRRGVGRGADRAAHRPPDLRRPAQPADDRRLRARARPPGRRRCAGSTTPTSGWTRDPGRAAASSSPARGATWASSTRACPCWLAAASTSDQPRPDRSGSGTPTPTHWTRPAGTDEAAPLVRRVGRARTRGRDRRRRASGRAQLADGRADHLALPRSTQRPSYPPCPPRSGRRGLAAVAAMRSTCRTSTTPRRRIRRSDLNASSCAAAWPTDADSRELPSGDESVGLPAHRRPARTGERGGGSTASTARPRRARVQRVLSGPRPGTASRSPGAAPPVLAGRATGLAAATRSRSVTRASRSPDRTAVRRQRRYRPAARRRSGA